MKKQLTLAITLLSFIGFSQSATFSTIPTSVNGTINICAGSTVLFNSTVAPNLLYAPAVYAWDFGNGQTSVLPGPIGITYATAGTFTVTYNISSAGTPLTQTSITVNVAAAPAVVPTIGPGNNCTQMTVINGIPVYQATGNNCQCPLNGPGPIVSLTNANTLPAGTSATVHWGAVGTGQLTNTFLIGTSNLLNPPNSFPGQQSGASPASHYNSPGAYNMIYMVTMPSGCVYSYYCIMSYGTASILLGANTAQTQCNPLLYNLTFANQTPGNTYVINWGDGTPNTTFTYPNLPVLPNGVPHSYAPSPCTNGVPQSYTIMVAATNSCASSTTTSTIGPFNVSAAPNASFTSAPSNTICQNQSITFTNTSNGGLSIANNTCSNVYNFGWNINFSAAASGAGYTVTSGSMGDPYNFPPINGSNVITAQFTQPGTYIVSLDAINAACGSGIEVQTITVNPIPVVPNQTATICSGSNFSIAPINNPPNTIVPAGTTYTWTVAANANITGEVGGTNDTIMGTLINITNVNQTVVYTVTPTVNGCSSGAPFTVTVTITVNQLPTVSAGANQSVCSGSAVTLNGSGATSYVWNNGVTNAVAFIPVSTQTYTVSGTNANGCVNTAQVTITVNPLPSVTNVVLAQAICSGAPTTALTWTSGVAASTFAWTAVGSSGSISGFVASGSGNLPVINGITNSSNTNQTITYSVTATKNGCSGPTIQYVITVYPTPVLTLSANQTVCGGAPTTLTSLSNSVAGGNFSWTLSNAGSVPGTITGYPNPVPGSGQIPASTINNAGISPYTLSYQVTPTANGCNGTSSPFTITVNPLPTVSAGANQTVCAGTAVTLNGSGATSYVWNNGVTNAVAFIPVSTQTYTVSGTNANGCVNTAQVTITVNPLPSVTNVVLAQAICSGAPTTAVTWTSGVAASTFAWTAVGSSGSISGFVASGSGNLPVINGITNSSNTNQTITYSVTATKNGCSGPTIQYVITVYPTPVLTLSANQTVCGGAPTTLTSLSNSVAGGNFSWTLSNAGSVPGTITGYPNPVPGSGQIPASTINNAGISPYTLSYQVTPTANGCNGTSSPFTITVNPLPTVSAGANQAVCTGTAVTLNGSGATSYVWNNGVTNAVAFIPVSTQTYSVTVTALNGCTNTAQVTVTVNPLPTVSGGTNPTVCVGTAVTLNGSGASSYVWNGGVTNAVAFTPLSTQTYTVTGTDANGCVNISQVTITVNSLPTVSAGANQTVCSGTAVTLNGSGASSYVWNGGVTNAVAFTPISTQTYTVTGINANGCVNTAQATITVIFPMVSAGADQSVCSGTAITLNGSGASSYAWNNGVTNAVAFTPVSSQTYTLIGTDANGCTGSDTVVVSVLENATSTITQTALDSYTLNGQTYTQSGTYTQVIPAANGCDSTITLNLTLNFTGIHELVNSNKILVKITDLNGKTIPRRKNTVMLFIYEDGTIERVVEME